MKLFLQNITDIMSFAKNDAVDIVTELFAYFSCFWIYTAVCDDDTAFFAAVLLL